MTDFSITQKINSKDYTRLIFWLLYKNIGIILVSILASLSLIAFIIQFIIFPKELMDADDKSYAMFVIFMAILLPLFTYISSKRGFKSNQKIQEETTTEFSEQGVNQHGESFHTNYTWEKIYRVRIIPGWLLVYHSRVGFNPIRLTIDDKSNIESLKEFLKSSNFKIKLKW